MIALVIALQLSLSPPTSGPGARAPFTVPLSDPAGQPTGSATVDGNRMYIRNLKGEHVSTIVIERDRETLYDPNGKILDQRQRP